MTNNETILFAALAAVCACIISSCQSEPVYLKSYFYEVALNPLVNYGTQSEIAAVGSELMAVVGDDGGSYRGTLSSPQDAQMKAGCEAIQKKYAAKNMGSIYFSFILRKITLDSNPESKTPKLVEEIAEYGFGDAMKNDYVFFVYTSNYTEAYAAFKEKMKGQEGSELYKEYGQTYLAIKQAFTDFLDTKGEGGSAAITDRPWKPSEGNLKFIKDGCDIIYNNNKDKKLPASLHYDVYTVDFFDNTKVTLIWQQTFEANVE